ncbi:MAG: TlpA family protein disulfide reductase [Dehalococcoidia bacterium]|nr:TlpA family protein disulfide reductase [Dehalococcoidia bacterium]
MPVWQKVYEELKGEGFTVITIAIERSPDDARPWIEAASAEHPSLIDTEHLVPDLYGMINVPTILWIDEEGRIVRPNDVAFGSNDFKEMTGIDSELHLERLRAWVRGEGPAMTPEEARAVQTLPTAAEQEARAEFTLAWWLSQRGHAEDAEPHYVRAGELAPHDFTIRRGTMLIRGLDPMGEDFMKIVNEWTEAGNAFYRPIEPVSAS